MSAFRAAADAGAHAIETDLHLSRDGVVVLSHDGTLRRCFGDGDSSDGKSKDRRISDYDWEYLRKLRTLREPKDGMPRLLDLLVWLAEPPQRHIWLLLDIKTDDPTDELVRRTRQTIESVSVGEGGRSWKDRIVLGCWNVSHRARTLFLVGRSAPS